MTDFLIGRAPFSSLAISRAMKEKLLLAAASAGITGETKAIGIKQWNDYSGILNALP